MSAAMGEHHLARLAEQSLERVGDYEQLFFEGAWHTNGQILDRARRAASGLTALGVAPGDRVIVLTMNTPEVFVGYHAIWRAGAVVTPVIFLQTPPELRHILEDSGAKVAIVSPELVPMVQGSADGLDLQLIVVGDVPDGVEATSFADLEAAEPGEIVPRADDDLRALLYTGGTTGRAKGVMLSHEGLWQAGRGMNLVAETMTATRSLLPLPLSHAFGLNVLVSGLHSERQHVSVMQRWFDPQGWLELVAEHRLQSSPVVPSMMQMLLDLPYADHDLSSLESFGSGGAPLLPHLREKVEKAFGVTILEGYGCTEASAIVTAMTVTDNRAGSVGKPAPHVQVAILDPLGQPVATGEEGEICVAGPGVMLGYWNEPELTARTVVDGWLHTGDVGRLDEDGFLYVVDRLKDLIIRGGFNVFPRDVEDALIEHDAVAAAAVVGVPDEKSGEEVVAVVALHPGHEADPEELKEYARARLAKYKYPREVRIVDAVPLTSVGKTDRKAVRALVNG
ncbi:long-chain fatty acid--CoA ligase [Nocardioides caeni]|uniref:Long-chain fatty acid--CoA ligase n=1 Tax=Nocardioides caeni TaxID=574700 RepID=A0A4S8MZC7_9ACTN|nr:AMP-binding protein [Nocardioides caeni]THV08830.1 long-chain fatty acid--CoA ligase [Nocardioides caeni]